MAVKPVATTLAEKPDLKGAPKALRNKVSWDNKLNTLTISAPLSAEETQILTSSVKTESAITAIAQAAETSRTTAVEFFQTPAELGERFLVPQLALRIQGDLQLFDDPEVLDYPWGLSTFDAAPTKDDLSKLGDGLKVSEGGVIDFDTNSGKVISRFLPELRRDLGLVYQPENWGQVRLAAWLKTLMDQNDFTLARANLQKFLVRDLLEARIRDLRRLAVRKAYQETLFGDDAGAKRSHSVLGSQSCPARRELILFTKSGRALLSGLFVQATRHRK